MVARRGDEWESDERQGRSREQEGRKREPKSVSDQRKKEEKKEMADALVVDQRILLRCVIDDNALRLRVRVVRFVTVLASDTAVLVSSPGRRRVVSVVGVDLRSSTTSADCSRMLPGIASGGRLRMGKKRAPKRDREPVCSTPGSPVLRPSSR